MTMIRDPKCRSCQGTLFPWGNQNNLWRCLKCGLQQDPKEKQKEVDTRWK